MGLCASTASKIIVFVLIVTLTSCASIGTRVLPLSRQGFNSALLQSDEEQILLNIVRMRYSDRPYFLNIDNITSANAFSLSTGANLSFSKTHNTNDEIPASPKSILERTYGLTPNVNYSDNPTIVYTPLQGEKFTRQMLTPISLESIYLLIQSGWSIARILRVTTQSIDDLPNAPSASRPITKHIPVFEHFVAFAHYLRKLHLEDFVIIKGERKNKVFSINMMIRQSYQKTPEVQKLLRMLHLSPTQNNIRLVVDEKVNAAKGILSIAPRSYLGILYYLSKSVEISEDDIKQGIIEVATYPNGQMFDWSRITQGMMKIHSSTAKPHHASVMVYYRDRWFYIADNDSDSKETLALIEQLFNLQAGEMSTKSPLLTVSV